MSKIKKIGLYLIVFYLIYTPNIGQFFGKSMIASKYVILTLALPLVIRHFIIKRKINKKIVILSAGIILSAVYFLMRALAAGYVSISDLRIFQNLFVLIHLSYFVYLYDYLQNKGYTKKDMLDLIMNVVLIQSILCIAMIFIPQLKGIANLLYNEGSTDFYDRRYIIRNRIYGICEDYTYGTPIFQGLMATIALIYGILKSKKYLLYVPFFIISSLLNGRTSMIIIVISIVILYTLMILYRKISIKKVGYLLAILIFAAIVGYMLYIFVPNTFQFISLAVQDMINYVFEDKTTGNIDVLTSKMTFWPQGINFVFGEGTRVFLKENYQHSDIGYVNDMFMGGLIYCMILYSSIITFLLSNSKDDENFINIVISCVMIATLLICNYKGEAMKGGILIVMTLSIKTLLLYGNKNVEKNSLVKGE